MCLTYWSSYVCSSVLPATRGRFIADTLALSDHILKTGSLDLPGFVAGPARVQLRNKDPKAWRAFADAFRAHSPTGSALTLRRVQAAQIGRASWRERMCLYVSISVGPVSFKKKTENE